MLTRIGQSAGIERRDLVLATMTKLKQVCNHPAQFLRDGSRLDGRSGKLDASTRSSTRSDPFLNLGWRGKDRDALLRRLRELRADVPADDDVPGGAVPSATGTALALADLPRPQRDLDRFWLPTPPATPAASRPGRGS